MLTKSSGNPGTRIADQDGRAPRHGEVSAYARAVGLARIVVRGRLQSGELHVGADGLIYPRPSATAEPNVVPFKQPPMAAPEPERPMWSSQCETFGILAERMIEDRPADKSPDDAAGDLNCKVRLALGSVLRRSAP